MGEGRPHSLMQTTVCYFEIAPFQWHAQGQSLQYLPHVIENFVRSKHKRPLGIVTLQACCDGVLVHDYEIDWRNGAVSFPIYDLVGTDPDRRLLTTLLLKTATLPVWTYGA